MTVHIKGFFEKFLKIDKNRTDLKKRFIESVKISCGIELVENQITFQNDKVLIAGTPALKNELFINKDKILKEYNRTAARKISVIQ